jgi:predicted nucleic acid-binding protein
MRKIITNSTPLIVLSALGQLELLHHYFDEVIIPDAVWQEVVINGKNRPGALEVRNCEWIRIQEVSDIIAVETLHLYLGIGESEAIILAKELNLPLIIDDKAGRRTAKALDLSVTGTIGILLKGSEDNLVNMDETVSGLISIGFRFDKETMTKMFT